MSSMKLDQLIDMKPIQRLAYSQYALARTPFCVLDGDGHPLVEICDNSACSACEMKQDGVGDKRGQHRRQTSVRPPCCHLSEQLATNEPSRSRCEMGLWRIVVPLRVGDQAIGAVSSGQFFLDCDIQKQGGTKYALAEEQAARTKPFLDALDQLPVFEHGDITDLEKHYSAMADVISSLASARLVVLDVCGRDGIPNAPNDAENNRSVQESARKRALL